MLKKLGRAYGQLSLPVRMSAWYLVCSVLQKGIAMISTPIFTRIMTEQEFGRYSIFNSWASILGTVISLNLAGGFYMRGLVLNEGDREGFTASLEGLTGLMCLLALLVYLPFHAAVDRLTGLTPFLMTMIILQIFLQNTHYFWRNRRRVDYRYRPIVAVTVATTVLIPALSIVLVRRSPRSFQTESRVLGTVLVELAVYIGMFLSIWRSGKTLYRRDYWKQAVLFALPLVPHYLSKIILNQSDRVMIGAFCGTTEAGYYSVAYSLAVIFQIFNQAVSTSLDPWLYRAIRDRSLEAARSITMKLLLVMLVLNLGVIAVAPEILRLFAPANYYSAVWVIPPITASVFFMFMYDLFTAFQYYYAKTRWVMYASMAGAALNVGLNLLFIPRFGFVAAGYTTLVCYILFGLAHYYFMCRVCDKYMDGLRPYDIRQILGIGLLLICGAAVLTVLYPFPVIRYLLLAAAAAGLLRQRKMLAELLRTIKK